jgi:hypothetical protein
MNTKQTREILEPAGKRPPGGEVRMRLENRQRRIQ